MTSELACSLCGQPHSPARTCAMVTVDTEQVARVVATAAARPLHVRWGLQPPAGVTRAWGMRAEYEWKWNGGHPSARIGLCWDRSDIQLANPRSEDAYAGAVNDKALIDWARDQIRGRLRDLLLSYSVDPASEQYVRFHDPLTNRVIVATPGRTYGYLLVGAWEQSESIKCPDGTCNVCSVR